MCELCDDFYDRYVEFIEDDEVDPEDDEADAELVEDVELEDDAADDADDLIGTDELGISVSDDLDNVTNVAFDLPTDRSATVDLGGVRITYSKAS